MRATGIDAVENAARRWKEAGQRGGERTRSRRRPDSYGEALANVGQDPVAAALAPRIYSANISQDLLKETTGRRHVSAARRKKQR